MIWYKTEDQLPPKDNDTELVGYGGNISSHVHGKYAIMRYNGSWWNECGTELSGPPDYWTVLDAPIGGD